MGKISTFELIDKYFSNPDCSYKNHRKIIKEEQLFNYEKQVGKEFADMNADELLDFISLINPRRNNAQSNDLIKDNTKNQIRTIYKQIFDYYIQNYDRSLKNPFIDIKFKETKNGSANKEHISYDRIVEIIDDFHIKYPSDRADYYELIIRLFLDGFEDATEIIEMKETDIDRQNKTVKISNRTVQLSDRCYGLLEKFNRLTVLEGWRNFALVSWHGSYFKFAVLPKNAQTIDERPLKKMRETINVYICKYLKNEYALGISYYNLNRLGFYEHLISLYGKKKTNEIITSNYKPELQKMLKQAAEEYQSKELNKIQVSQLKRNLRNFVDEQN